MAPTDPRTGSLPRDSCGWPNLPKRRLKPVTDESAEWGTGHSIRVRSRVHRKRECRDVRLWFTRKLRCVNFSNQEKSRVAMTVALAARFARYFCYESATTPGRTSEHE